MKKIVALILASVMVFSLAACGSSDATSKAESKAAAAVSEAKSAAAEAVSEAKSAAAEAVSEAKSAATEAVSEAVSAVSEAATEVAEAAPAGDKQLKFGFVMMGMGNEFFEGIVAAVLETMQGLGWEASYVSGEFDVQKQIEAIENYTADQVDVLLVFPVNGPAVTAAVAKAREAGIKVIIMVDETTDEQWDAFLSSDNEATGRANAWLAADYINKNYPDAEPGSIPVALIQVFDTPTDEQQSLGLEAITEYTDKVSIVKYEIAGQNKEDGQKAAETLYVTNPEVKLFVTTSNVVSLGIDSFYTGMGSPVDPSELGDYATWGTNASEEAIQGIINSLENKCILRGINIQAGIGETAANIARIATGLMDGTVDHEDSPANVYLINADNIFEYIENEKTSLQWDLENKTAKEVPLG